jgi:CDP-4-dehydro-6-deoxyglucose reductase
VRLLSGEVEAVTPSDFHFSLRERNDHYILLCSNRALSDLVVQAEEAHSPADIPLQKLVAKMAKIELHGEGVRILHLRTPRTQTLRFMAGQHACLNLPGVGQFDAAIASCPCNGMHLQFHFAAHQDVPFVAAVFKGMRSGEQIEVEGPFGELSLDDDSTRPLMMLAMGTEFAAIKSLIEHAINLDLRQPVRMIWMAPESQGHYLENYCRAWEDVFDDYRFLALTFSGDDLGRDERALLRQAIEEQMKDIQGVDAYIAGSSLFREVAREHLLTLGEDGDRLFELRRRSMGRAESHAVQA